MMIDFGMMSAKQLAAMGIVTSEQIISATVRDTETLRRRYSQDPTQQALVDRINGEVDICANMIAGACAGQTLRLYRIGGGRGTRSIPLHRAKAIARGEFGRKAQSLIESSENIVELEQHPALDLVRRPNPFYPGSSLEYMSFKFRTVNGNWYWILTDDGNGGTMMWPGYPQFTQPVFDDRNFISHYTFGRDTTDMVNIPPEQVFHFRNRILNKSNPLMGEGEIAGVLVEADLIQSTQLHDLAFQRNGCRPDALITVNAPEPVQPDQLDAVYDKIEEWKIGGRREGMPFVGQYIDWKPLTFNPKDMMTAEKVEAARKMIRRACGIPESMADSNASTYASSLVADAQMGRVVWQKLVDDAAQKTEWLLPYFGEDPTRFSFAYDNPVPKDTQAEATMLSSIVTIGGMSINEMRAELGYEPSTDPNAERLLFQGRPLAEVVAPPPSPFGGLFGGGGSRPSEPEAPPEPQNDSVSAPEEPQDDPEGTKSAPNLPQDDTIGEPKEPHNEPNHPVSPEGSVLKAALAREGSQWVPTCNCESCRQTKAADPNPFPPGEERDLYESFGPEFRDTLQDIIEDAQAESIRAYYDGEEPELVSYRDQAQRVIQDQVQAMAERAIRIEATRLGMADDFFDLIPENAVRFAQNYSLELADDILGTTAEIAKEAVVTGVREGLSINNIQKEMVGVPEYRAEMIARTETSRAMNGSRYESWAAMGATHAEWDLRPGGCPLCDGIKAKGPVPLYTLFAQPGERINGKKVGRGVLHAPAHPNCGCSTEALFPEDMGGGE